MRYIKFQRCISICVTIPQKIFFVVLKDFSKINITRSESYKCGNLQYASELKQTIQLFNNLLNFP